MKKVLLILTMSFISSSVFAKDCVVTIEAHEGKTEDVPFKDVDTNRFQVYSLGLSDYFFSVSETYIYIHKGHEEEFEYNAVASTEGDSINIVTDVFDEMAGEYKWIHVKCKD